MNGLKNYLKTSFSKSVLFDTGVLVDFLVGDKKVISFFEEYVFSGQLTPTISTLTVSELFMAARNKKEEAELEQWLKGLFDILPLNYDVAKTAGLMKRNNKTRPPDAIIAATANFYKLPLVTTSPEEYRGLDLRLFGPHI